MKFAMKNPRLRFGLIALLLCSLLITIAPGKDNRRKDTNRLPFEPTEELVYEGELSRAILRGIDVAELRFTAKRAEVTSGSASSNLQFTIDAVTKGILRKLFRLDYHQHVESTVEPSSFSVLQTTKLDQQGKRLRTSEAIFDRNEGKVIWTERDPNDPKREPRVVTSEMSGAVQDIASAFYYLRTQPLTLGTRFEILISDSGQVYHIPVTVSERKKMKTVIGEVQTLKVEPEIFGDNRLLRGKGKLAIWFTDDARHIPVRAKINNDLGTLDIKLKKMMGSQTQERR